MFGHVENKSFNLDIVINDIVEILNFINKNVNLNNKGELIVPKSKAVDYMGFTQKMLIKVIKDDNQKNSIEKYSHILKVLFDNESLKIFLHNYIRIILIKKKKMLKQQKI